MSYDVSLYTLRFAHRGRQDSTVLAYVMKTLNERYDYGVHLYLLSIDEGITGYRDDSLEVRPTHLPQLKQLTSNIPIRRSSETNSNTQCL